MECQNFVGQSKQELCNYCRCYLGKQVCIIMDKIFVLEHIIVENDYLIESKAFLTNELKESVRWGRQELKKMKVCTHDENDLNTIFEKVIVGNKENIEKTFKYVTKQTKKISDNIEKNLCCSW